MSKVFEGTPGPWFHHPASGYEHAMGGYISASPDRLGLPAICDIRGHGGMPYKENARLIAEAGTVLHETGLTPRQLAEQRAELLEAFREIASEARLDAEDDDQSRTESDDPSRIAYLTASASMCRIFADKIDRTIANATQQRNATGGEG